MPASRVQTALIYVDSDDALRKLATRLLSERALAVDTESNSLFAYRERLCLIQITGSLGDALVDPLAGVDLSPLVPVFADPGIVKVFHDAEYDILTLKRAHPFEFTSVFDTKVAAMSLGRQNLGLAAALAEHFDVRLDKKLQRSDWGQRPLSAEQMEYARLDTHYLVQLARKLRDAVLAAGPIHVLEVAAECRRLEGLVPAPRRLDPDAFADLRGAEHLDPLARRRLRELFAMRERIAEGRDQPPFKILGNEHLLEIARRAPRTHEELAAVPGLSPKLVERLGRPLLEALRRAARLRPIAVLPRGEGDDLDALSPGQRRTYERLRTWRKNVAAARKVDASLVLPRAVLLHLARVRPQPRDIDGLLASGLLEPWRVEHYGAGILAAFG